MKINDYFYAKKLNDGNIETNVFSKDGSAIIYEKIDVNWKYAQNLMKIIKQTNKSINSKNYELSRLYKLAGMNDQTIFERLLDENVSDTNDDTNDNNTTANLNPADIKLDNCKKLVAKVRNFFSEFDFNPSFRFINTLGSFSTYNDINNYVINYFKIQNHEYAAEVKERLQSHEWRILANDFVNNINPSTKINSRLKLYFGEPGTGKTTAAIAEAPKCIIASSDMLPADLIQNFVFDENGNPEFDPSDLWIAMEKGEKIVVDEINMLPFESLRFLQGITDGKKSFDWRGHTVEIKDGFQIIGTMNLTVGEVTMAIPAPLVDRCIEIKEFVIEDEDLAQALI